MNTLNDYCLLHIFQYFSPAEKLIIEKVCKRWQQLVQRLWQQMFLLRIEDGKKLYKKQYTLMSYETMKKLIQRGGRRVQHLDLENMIAMDEFLAVHFGAYTYRLLSSNFPIIELLEMLAKYCHNLISLFLNTKTILPTHLQTLLESNKNLLKIKICGIDNQTVIDRYLELLPNCLEKLDLFFIDCQLKHGLCTLIQRSPNLTDLRCICYEANCELGLTEGVLQAVGNYAMHLNRLHLRQMDLRVSELSLHCISTLSNLEYLKLERFDYVLTDDIIVQILNCKKLRLISFCGCPRVSSSGISSLLSDLPYLEDFEIFHSNVSELISPKFNTTILNLKRLSLTNCPSLLEDSLCHVVGLSPNIGILFVSECKLGTKTISFLITNSILREKNFLLKKWKAVNAVPFKIIVKKKDDADCDEQQNCNSNMRFLIYNNEEYDEIDISTNIAITLYLQQFISTNLKNCQLLQ